MRQAPRSILLVLSLLAAGTALPWSATAAGSGIPTNEALADGSLEGAPGGGYELRYEGAQTTPVARTGHQAVDLGKAGANPQPWNALAMVRAYVSAAVPLATLTSLSYAYEAPVPGTATLQTILKIGDADGTLIACLYSGAAPLDASTTYSLVTLDPSAGFTVAGPGCDGGPTQTLGDYLAANPTQTLLSFSLQTLVGPGAWPPGQPIYVDDLSVLTASIRIVPSTLDACGLAGYATIPDALACATAGATVLVQPGVYPGFTLDRAITVCATSVGGLACEDRTDVVIDGPSNAVTIVDVRAPDATLRGFVVQNPNLTLTDQGTGGPVAASLVSIHADRARLTGNLIRSLGTQPAPLTSRALTVGIDVVSGNDITIADNRVVNMVSGRGVDGTCPGGRCEAIGIRAGPGALRLVIDGNPIDLRTGGARSTGVELGAEGAVLRATIINLAGNATPSTFSTGIRIGADNVRVSGNIMQSADRTHAAALGIGGSGAGLVIENTTLVGFERGIDIASTGAVLLYQEAFASTAAPIRIMGGAPTLVGNYVVSGAATAVNLDGVTSATLSANLLRASTATLRLGPAVHDITIDARENDWGLRSRSAILASIRDEGARNQLDVRCYVDATPTSRVCPPTAGLTVNGSTWRTPIAFADASMSGGRAIVRWNWTFSDGATASGANVSHVFAAPGAASVSLDITDADGWTATSSRSLVITDAPPVLMPVGDAVVAENTTIAFRLAASDPDGDPITFRATGLPAGATFDAVSGNVSWRPNFTQEGVYPVTFAASDGFLADAETINITVGHSNAPPTLSISGALYGREGSPLTFLVRGVDVDNDHVALYASVLPLNAEFTDYGNGTALFSWTPDYFQSGDAPLTLSAEDGQNLTQNVINLHVADVDRAPVFDTLSNLTSAETVPIQIQVTATDPDGDALAYSARRIPSGATFDPAARVLRWVPSYTQAGVYVVQFVASDGNLTTIQNLTITVTDTDRAPVLAPLADQAARAGTTLTVPLAASDPDTSDVLVFSSGDAPTGVSFQGNSLVWASAPSQAGYYLFHVTVSDGTLSATRPLNVTLFTNAAPIVNLTAPSRADAGVPARFSGFGSKDPDGNSARLTFAWDFDAANGIGTDATGANVSWSFTSLGLHTVTLRVTDQDGVTTTVNTTVLVDDQLELRLAMYIPSGGAALGFVSLVDNPVGPLVGQRVNITVSWQPAPGGPKIVLAAFKATTKANGVTAFNVPRDLVALDLPGTHVVDVETGIDTSYLGDAEHATASATYEPGILV